MNRSNHTDLSNLKDSYDKKKPLIRQRLREFEEFFERSDDKAVFEELVFCILTSNAGARMGLRAVEAIKHILYEGSQDDIKNILKHAYRYPSHANYVVTTRDFLIKHYGLKLKDLLLSFDDPIERRDFFALTKSIKGIGYKQASHFLRNVGFRGYTILDKHILNSLYEFGVIDNPKPPSSRKRYLEVEEKLIAFAKDLGIDIDEIDLLLWSEKTGEILK